MEENQLIKGLSVVNSSIINGYSGTDKKVLELSVTMNDIYPDGGAWQYLYKEDLLALAVELTHIAQILSSKEDYTISANDHVNKDKEIE
jgi:hypothetical protein